MDEAQQVQPVEVVESPTVPPAEHKNLLLPSVDRWPEDRPIIELIDVSLSFGTKRVLDGLSLQIMPRKTTVIVGRGGSGKTVLLKLMMGLLAPDRGRVILFGRDLATVSEVEILELRKRMGMLFQNYALFDALSVEDNVGFSLHTSSKLPDRDVDALSHELIRMLGLSGSEELLPGSLSGGMKKRVSLARALVTNPEVVLFDEPTTGLDPIMVEKVDELILLAKQHYELTSVIISHDMASVKRLADRVAFLHDGKIIFEGTYEQLLHSEIAPIRTFLGDEQGAHPHHVPHQVADAPVIELIGVHKHFGTNHVLRGVDLAIYPSLTTVLIGASGSGKSVLVKHIMGFLKPDAGKILVFGKDIVPLHDRDLDEVRQSFGLVFQHGALLDWLSVEDNVAFPLLEQRRMSKREIHERVDEMIKHLGLTELRHRMPGAISVGERKRVALARAMVMRPAVLIYDEPTTGQDPLRTHEIDDLILYTQDQFHVTSIVISHDMESTFRIADRIALLHEGTIVAYGTPDELRGSRDPHVQRFLKASAA